MIKSTKIEVQAHYPAVFITNYFTPVEFFVQKQAGESWTGNGNSSRAIYNLKLSVFVGT